MDLQETHFSSSPKVTTYKVLTHRLASPIALDNCVDQREDGASPRNLQLTINTQTRTTPEKRRTSCSQQS